MSSPPNGQNGLYTYASFEPKKNGQKRGSHFLWWCSGAYQQLLRHYPTEHTKYAGLGAVLLATFVLAALSAGYAVYSVFENIYWTLAFALIWGVIIFNFDRFLVSTMRRYAVPFSKQLQLALPRFALALLIGLTIARPLELKIFEKEIDVKVEENRHKKTILNDSLLQQENRSVLITAMDERSRLQDRKSALEDSLHRLQQAYLQEADGTGGSGNRGVERITRLKMDAYNHALSQYSPELNLISQQLHYQDSLLRQLNTSIENKRREYGALLPGKVGFLERNKALSDLSAEEASVFWANLLVSLLIILIEIGPILSKLIVSAGPYDIALARIELSQMAESENGIRKDNEHVYEKLKNIYRRKKEVSDELLEKITALQKEVLESDVEKWKKWEWKENTASQPLNKLVRSMKEKYDYQEEDMI